MLHTVHEKHERHEKIESSMFPGLRHASFQSWRWALLIVPVPGFFSCFLCLSWTTLFY